MKYIRALAVSLSLLVTASGGRAIDPVPGADQIAAADAALEKFTSPVLTRFSTEEEFKAYATAVRASAKAHGSYWASRSFQAGVGSSLMAFGQDSQPVPAQPSECPEDNPECVDAADSGHIVVTGSSVTPRNPSITNNQMRGVEEGDIVKQIDDFLLVLQDGRIFVINIKANGRQRLALTDRANVYRSSDADTWYDEMLVFGDRVLITGYSYGKDATELTVFRLSGAGKLTREGVFTISSNDYYSTSNYATRLIGDNLVIYTPFNVLAMTRNVGDWPVIRRLHPNDIEQDVGAKEPVRRPLFDARSIYRPVITETNPTVHTVSVCPLGTAGEGKDLDCRASAFIGSPAVEWYVTNDNAYVWTGSPSSLGGYVDRECAADEQFRLEDTEGALIYRVEHANGSPALVAAQGAPIDQFSMLAGKGRFHSLLRMRSRACYEGWNSPARLSFFSISEAAFSDRLTPVAEQSFTRLPGTGTRWVVNRFTDNYLVYGSMSRYRRGLPKIDWDDYDDPEDRKRMQAALAMPPVRVVPIDTPSRVVSLDIRHTVIRAEQYGEDVVVTGYRDSNGLRISRLSLKGAPRIGSSAILDGRFESEGRSHAFSSLIEANGGGLMGLPTVKRRSEGGRYWWRSTASDVSFIGVDRTGRLAPLGELERKLDYSDDDDDDGIAGYECEVSCVDWYGNSRPIFTDGRVFALSGAELIEGRIQSGAIIEAQRLNFAVASTSMAQLSAR